LPWNTPSKASPHPDQARKDFLPRSHTSKVTKTVETEKWLKFWLSEVKSYISSNHPRFVWGVVECIYLTYYGFSNEALKLFAYKYDMDVVISFYKHSLAIF